MIPGPPAETLLVHRDAAVSVSLLWRWLYRPVGSLQGDGAVCTAGAPVGGLKEDPDREPSRSSGRTLGKPRRAEEQGKRAGPSGRMVER